MSDAFDPRARLKAIEETWLKGTIDHDSLMRFISGTLSGDGVEQQDAKAAAYFLLELIEGAKHGADLNAVMNHQLGVKKLRRNVFRPDDATMHSPEFGVAMQYAAGDLKHVDAVRALQSMHPASARQAEAWLAALRPRAEQTLRALEHVRSRT